MNTSPPSISAFYGSKLRQEVLRLAGVGRARGVVWVLGVVAIVIASGFLSACGSGKGSEPSTPAPAPAPIDPPVPTPTPLPPAPPSSVFSTSYEYKQDARAMASTAVFSSNLLGLKILDADSRNAVTFGDYFREGVGHYSAFVMVNNPGGLGSAHFFQNQAGVWVDKTSSILKDMSGCQTATFAITADFNGDHRHDVLVTCKGTPNNGKEAQILYLSNDATGVYQKVFLHNPAMINYQFKAEQAAAADLNGDGLMDLVVADPNQPAIVLMAQKSAVSSDVSFVQVTDRIIDSASNPMLPTQLHGVQIIPYPGAAKRLDLILMGGLINNNVGTKGNGLPTLWIKGSADTTVTLSPQAGTFFYSNSGYAQGFPITTMESTDVFYEPGFFFLNLQDPAHTQMRVARISESTWVETLPSMTLAATYGDGISLQVIRNSAGKIVVYDGDCKPQAQAVSTSRCSFITQ